MRSKEKGARQKARQKYRSALSAYLFEIIGNKHLVLACIPYPICSDAHPVETMQRFMDAWEKEKLSPEYQKRKEMSERSTEQQKANKLAAHAARQRENRGKTINDNIESGCWSPAKLTNADKKLQADFKSGILTRHRKKCDEAFGWNRQLSDELQCAAVRMMR